MSQLTMLRLARAQLRRQRVLAAALGAGLAAALALASTAALMQSVAAETGLQSTIARSARADYLEVQRQDISTADAFDRFQAESAASFRQQVGAYALPGAHSVSSGALVVPIVNGVQVGTDGPYPLASYYDGVERHGVLTQGAWPGDSLGPQGSIAVAISVASQQQLRLNVGDIGCARPILRGADRPDGFCFLVTGIWKPVSETDPYWAGTLPNLNLVFSKAGFFKAAAAMPNATMRASQDWVPDVGAIHASNAAEVAARVATLRGQLGVSRNATFISGLDKTIDGYEDRLQSSQLAALLVGLALAALAAYAVAFVALHFLAGQRQAIALWRTRGWGRGRAWALLLLELGLVGAVALPLGAAAALPVVGLLAGPVFQTTGLTPAELAAALPSVATGVLGAALLLGALAALEARRALEEARRGPAPPGSAVWWRRPQLDAIMAAAGALLLAEVRFRGASADATDPLGLLLPALGLGLLATAALRLLPPAARLAAAGGGVSGSLAAWQLARRPGQYARLALLLSFAIAIGLFASAYAATDHRNAVDRSAYAAGSDLRIDFQQTDQPPQIDQALAGLPGLDSSTQVYRASGRPGRSDFDTTVLGIDGQSFWKTAWRRGDLASEPLDTLTQRLVAMDPDGVPIPGSPAAIAVTVYSSGLDASLSAALSDASGAYLTAAFGPLGEAGWHRLQAPLPGSGTGAVGLAVHLSRGTLELEPPAGRKPLPALLSSQTMARLGLRVNEAFPLHLDANDVQLVPVGVVDYFPTLYPGLEDFMVVPRVAILDRLLRQNAEAWTNEAWVRLAGPGAAAAGSLKSNPQVTALSVRQDLQDQALSDPLRIALDAELVLGFLAALGMVVISFGLHFLVAARSRVSEYAILQANGLPAASVRRSLLIEQAVLLGYSLVVGAAMGLLLAWVVLPTLQLSGDPADRIPPTVLQVDAVTASGAILAVALAGALIGQLAGRLGSRFDLLTELRSIA